MNAAAKTIDRTERGLKAAAFLSTIFAGKPDDGLISIWTLEGEQKTSRFFVEPGEAALYAVAQRDAQVYVGVGWRLADLGPHARGGLDDVGGIVGLWADIDIAGPGHASKAYPPTREAALSLVEALPVPPSMMVWTGGGFHPWWLFREGWQFDSAEERDSAARLARGWGAAIQQIARFRGYTLDPVFDLPRVLRVPGTYRTKPEDPSPVLVQVESQSDRRYNPSDFELFLDSAPPAPTLRQVGDLTLDAGAQPPFDKFMALKDVEPKFNGAWEHKRRDLKDQSASSYDMALASYAAQANWSDQEIVNLLIAHRRKWGEDLKLTHEWGQGEGRTDYYRHTVSKTRRDREKQDSARDSLLALDAAVADETTPRSVLLSAASKTIGLEISRVTQTGREQAQYGIILSDGRDITLGTIETLFSQMKTRARIGEAINVVIEQVKAGEWFTVGTALVRSAEVVEPEDSTPRGQLMEWLRLYLKNGVQWRDDDWAEALRRSEPFIRDERLHIHTGHFVRYLKLSLFEDVELPRLRHNLRSAGFLYKKVSGRLDIGVVCLGYWSAPDAILYEHEGFDAGPEPPPALSDL